MRQITLLTLIWNHLFPLKNTIFRQAIPNVYHQLKLTFAQTKTIRIKPKNVLHTANTVIFLSLIHLNSVALPTLTLFTASERYLFCVIIVYFSIKPHLVKQKFKVLLRRLLSYSKRLFYKSAMLKSNNRLTKVSVIWTYNTNFSLIFVLMMVLHSVLDNIYLFLCYVYYTLI